MRDTYQSSRDRLSTALSREGFAVLPSEGTYFVCVDLAASGIELGDVDFCRWLVAEAKVAAIPVSPFQTEATASAVMRLCFAKSDDVLDEAAARLARARRWSLPQ